MNIQLEKAAIIKRFEKINDESLVKTIKSLLDYALSKGENDEMLESRLREG